MRLESEKYLHDIQHASGLLNDFTSGKAFVDYENDAMLRSAVERQFEIIGEAMVNLTRIDEPAVAQITEFRRIINFRNILIHNYTNIDNRVVWETLETDIPILSQEVESLLEGTRDGNMTMMNTEFRSE